jgi:hypothetical protein
MSSTSGSWSTSGYHAYPSGSWSTFGYHALPEFHGGGHDRVMADIDNRVEQLTAVHCYLHITKSLVRAPPTQSPDHFRPSTLGRGSSNPLKSAPRRGALTSSTETPPLLINHSYRPGTPKRAGQSDKKGWDGWDAVEAGQRLSKRCKGCSDGTMGR